MPADTMPIGDVVVRGDHPLRVRKEELGAIGKALGADYEPIIVTMEGVLLDGRTRLEALRQRQDPKVFVRKIDIGDPAVATRHACSEYLGKPTSKLNRLWRLLHISREYQRLHPDTLPVTVRGGPGRGGKTMAEPAAVSFADHAAVPGASARTIRDHLQLARALAPEVYSLLEGTGDDNYLERLRQLGKLAPADQVEIAQVVAARKMGLRQAVVERRWIAAHPSAERVEYSESTMRPGDFAEVAAGIADGSVDLVLTDVPWTKPCRDRFPEMASVFRSKLRPGGAALVMVGQRWVPEMLDALRGASLEYVWLSHYEHPEPQCPPHDGVGISFGYPVVVLYQAGQPRTANDPSDMFREIVGAPVDVPPHPHRKSVEALERMILAYSHPEDVIYDPFLGSGATALAAYRTRRRFVGSDISPEHVEAARLAVGATVWGCDIDDDDRLKADRPLDDCVSDDDFAWVLKSM